MRPSPATFRLMPGGWALAAGSISDEAAGGARDRIGLSAWCGSASERGAGRSLYRLVGSAACRLGTQWPPVLRQRAISTPDSPTTTATRAARGSMDWRATPHTRQFADEAGLT